jgi:hypothetical protein
LHFCHAPNPPESAAQLVRAGVAPFGRLHFVAQRASDDSYVTLIGRGVIIADRALLRARWQPAWNQFFPAGADDETSIFVQLVADRIELWVRGVTPEPFGTRGAILERGPGPPWRMVQG